MAINRNSLSNSSSESGSPFTTAATFSAGGIRVGIRSMVGGLQPVRQAPRSDPQNRTFSLEGDVLNHTPLRSSPTKGYLVLPPGFTDGEEEEGPVSKICRLGESVSRYFLMTSSLRLITAAPCRLFINLSACNSAL